jgi:phosphoglycolate phosphatase-like HAD superfamily hydrolase
MKWTSPPQKNQGQFFQMNIQNTFQELLSHPLTASQTEKETPSSSAHLNALYRKENIQTQLQKYQGLSASDHLAKSNKLNPTALSISVPEVSGLYHVRSPEHNQLPLFFSDYETELPELASIQTLPEKDQAFYEVRYIAKRGRDMHTDLPIDNTNNTEGLKKSPKLMEQTGPIRAIRSEAATATVDRYTNMQSNYLAQLHQHVITQLPKNMLDQGGQVHLLRPTCHHYASDATMNFLTFCTQTEIARTLNHIEQQAAQQAKRPPIEFTDYKSCITISRTARTESSPIGRLVQQGYFATDEIAQGDQVILVDDHVQVGGSILAMAAAAKEAGANVLGLCALTTHPHSISLAMREDVKNHLLHTMKQWDPENKVLKELSNMGMPINTLTNAEALILIAYATNPHDEHAIRTFNAIEQSLTNHQHVMEGEHDSLKPILDAIPSTPEMILADIQKTAKATRKNVQHAPVKRVEVLDWDCCLTNEKAMNYQLMHNALAIAAHEHADKYPEIRAISKAIQPYIHGEKYQDGMPKLCMGADRFTEFGITNPAFWKKHIPIDLIQKLSSFAPDIHIETNRKTPIISILQHEFKRQYKALTRPPIPADVQARISAIQTAKNIDLPFKNIQLEFMPGAKEFLEQHRKPNTRLLLISNKENHDLHNEVNKLAVAHYFDHISGVETITQDNNIKKHFSKPNNTRLIRTLQENALIHQPLQMQLVGDQIQDITQAQALLNDTRKSIRGLLVAPKKPENFALLQSTGIPVQYTTTLKNIPKNK